jgi:hypothetical protein
MSNNFDDDDAPPELIDVSAMPADQTSKDEEPPKARVPITLVTGMYRWTTFQFALNFKNNPLVRIPRRRKNNPVELHSHGETRQENCRHHEWFVKSI